MTLLVVISGLIMKHWDDNVLQADLVPWGAIPFLIFMLIFYWRWLITFYHASDYDVRRRDLYLTKAQVICYYMSKELSQRYGDCKNVYLNLGNGKNRKITEKCLLKKRYPDIKPQTVVECPSQPTVWGNRHFYFHLFAPAGLTLLIVIGLWIKFFTNNVQQ